MTPYNRLRNCLEFLQNEGITLYATEKGLCLTGPRASLHAYFLGKILRSNATHVPIVDWKGARITLCSTTRVAHLAEFEPFEKDPELEWFPLKNTCIEEARPEGAETVNTTFYVARPQTPL